MSEHIEQIDVLKVSDTPSIDPVDVHLDHVASIVIIGFTLAILAITATLAAYRLVRGLQRRQSGHYTPGEHRILWAVLVVATAYVGHKLWTRLHLAFRVRDLFLAPAFAAGFLWCAQWWLREEQLRFAEYDAQDAKAKLAAKKGGKKVE